MTDKPCTRRIAILVETANPSPHGLIGLTELANRGADITLVSIHERGPFHDAVEAAGFRSEALCAGSAAGYPSAIHKLAHTLRRRRVEIVQCVGPIPTVIGGLACRLSPGTRTLYHRQHLLPADKNIVVLAARLLAHRTMVVSNTVARRAIDVEGISPDRLCVALHGIAPLRQVSETEQFALRNELEIPNEASIVLAVAILRPVKGIDLLVAAMPKLASRLSKEVHLVVVGDGPSRSELEREARRTFGSRSHFVGYKHDVAPWLSVADVVAIPSRTEAFCLVAAEAMAANRPIVATAVGALPEVLGSEAGTFVPSEDVASLARALGDILTDPHRATMLAEAGHRQFLEHYTTSAMVDAWINCYARM